MKIVEKFTDLDKANAYVTDLNSAYGVSVEEAKATSEKLKLTEKDLSTARSETATANKAHEKALAEVGELSSKLDLQEKHGSKGGTIVSINKKSYQLSGNRFITQNGEKTAEEVSKDKDFLKHLLEIGSGALVALD